MNQAQRAPIGWIPATVAGVVGGSLGGCIVGLAEACYLLLSAREIVDYQVFPYAAVLYGISGVVLGTATALATFASGLVLRRRIPPARLWAAGFVLPLGFLGAVISIWILCRDFNGGAMLDTQVIYGILGGYVVLSGVLFVLASGAIARTMLRVLLTPLGGMVSYGGIMAFLLLMHLGAGQLGEQPAATMEPVPELEDRPSILLIGVDTLRADHLGCYGSQEGLTPSIDALARDSVLYEQAVAQASWTRASFASIMTSMFPSSHQAYRKSDVLSDEVTTLAEVLSDAGYTTAARINNTNLTARFGFQQGFTDFEFMAPYYPFEATETTYFLVLYDLMRRYIGEKLLSGDRTVTTYYHDGREVTDEAIRYLGEHRNDRFFLFVHYMDPHDPYFSHPYDGHAVARIDDEFPDPARAEEIRTLYEGEVRYLDYQLARLFNYLQQENMFNEMLIVLVSDHGEEFLEHGGWWHGTTLYEEQIHVPLIVKYPLGFRYRSREHQFEPIVVRNGSRVADQVRCIDIAPTVATLAGVEPPAGWQGVSLTTDWDLRAERDKLAISEADYEGNQLRTLRTTNWKLILAREKGRRGNPPCGLFSLAIDPDERRNRCGEADLTGLQAAMEGEIEAFKGRASDTAVERQQTAIDLETCHRLKVLGYVHPTVDCSQF